MLNKPSFSILQNARYALEGFVDVFQNETSFKWQIVLFLGLCFLVFFLNFSFEIRALLLFITFLPPISETINSSIERTVDLVTKEFHPLAKKAKDMGSLIVFLSLICTATVWIFCLFNYFFKD